MKTRVHFFVTGLGIIPLWLLGILGCRMNGDKTPMEEREQEAIVSFDFVKTFPHKVWISNWSKDESYPDGLRYKLMSVRMEPENKVEFVITLQERNGDKHELSRDIYSSVDFFERASRSMVNGLESEYQIDFELQDFSSVRTEDEFTKLANEYGWFEPVD